MSSTAPSLGSAERRDDTITFTAGQELGATTINYQVSDEGGAVARGSLSVQIIEKANVAPIARGDARTVFGPGVPMSFDVLDDAFDPDDTPGGMSVVSAETLSRRRHASVTGRVVTITPTPSFVGTIVVTFTIADGDGLTATAQLSLTVLPPLNRPPLARDDSTEVANGASVTVPVLFNDSDPDGDPLDIDITSGPDQSLGTARLTNERSIAFTAAPGASGVASIDYSISDGEFSSDARLRITVRPCSESQPVAVDGFLQTGYEQPIAVDLNAFGANGVFVDVVGPTGYADGLYTPPAGENGNVSVSYTVVNGCRQRASATVTIDVNQDPLVRDQSLAVGRGESREIPVSSIASDAEPLEIQSSEGAPAWVTTESGRLVVNPPIGTPIGTVTWTTIVRDPGGLTGAVPMSVAVTNQLPLAVPDSVDVTLGSPTLAPVVDNDVDPDAPNSDLAIQSVPATIMFPNGEEGTISLVADRKLSIDPGKGEGTTTFTYTVHDADGGVSEPATVTVVGPPLNTPPFARDQSFDVVTTVPTDIVLDAGDDDGDEISVEDIVDPAGIVTGQAGLSLTITAPAPGVYTITYHVDDGDDVSRTATVTINAT